MRCAGHAIARSDAGRSAHAPAVALRAISCAVAPDNSIGDAGGAAIAEALMINKTVTTINLSGAL